MDAATLTPNYSEARLWPSFEDARLFANSCGYPSARVSNRVGLAFHVEIPGGGGRLWDYVAKLDAPSYAPDPIPNRDDWVPACGGTEVPFKARNGRTLLYCFNRHDQRHAYLDVETDLILSDDEAWLVLGGGRPRSVISLPVPVALCSRCDQPKRLDGITGQCTECLEEGWSKEVGNATS